LGTRFRKPLLYPLSYGGATGHDSAAPKRVRVMLWTLRDVSELPLSLGTRKAGKAWRFAGR
jgi:hypothetical protein